MEMNAHRSANTPGGFDPKRSAQRWWSSVGTLQYPGSISGANGIRMSPYIYRDRDDLQRFFSSETDRDGCITNRADRGDGITAAMLLVCLLLHFAPVQQLTRCDQHAHREQE